MDMLDVEMKVIPPEQNSAVYGGRRYETERKTEIEIHTWIPSKETSRKMGWQTSTFSIAWTGDRQTHKSIQGEKTKKKQHFAGMYYNNNNNMFICIAP